MIHSALGLNGSVTAPHRLAALAGRDVLVAGGTAIEAMVAMAAAVAVVYPQMNGIGGDAFWLIHQPGKEPVAISGAGRAAALATPDWYASRGYTEIPARGPDATLLVPGAIATWQLALELDPDNRMTLAQLLGAAIGHAEHGIAVSQSQSRLTASRFAELSPVTGFADVWLKDGRAPLPGERLELKGLATTLRHLAEHGLDSFYRGELARRNADFLEAVGTPLRLADFEAYRAAFVTPLRMEHSTGTLYNLPPPTQGIASLVILGLFDRLGVTEGEGFAHVHGLVEATKQAYRLRNRHVGDPTTMTERPEDWLQPENLDRLAAGIDRDRAAVWPDPAKAGDTVWMAAADKHGNVVSFIQSLFWEFGSGVTNPETGIVFENRGAGFSLQPGPNQLAPGKQPFHTLNPALARFSDGRVMAYGNMGGEGQPQSQSAVFSRYGQFGMGLQRAVTAPRWLLGKTWGDVNTRLKLESRFDPALVAELKAAGHDVEIVDDFDDRMGHAGAIVVHPSGLHEAATDPRADGAALAF
jgi:gamma-glutamyltranspeptidase/glutathione hydrolase